MYIAPNPRPDDDPWFAVRLACMPIIGLMIGTVLMSPMLTIFPTILTSLMAGNRKAFNPGKVFGAPIALGGGLWVMSGVVALTYQSPLLLIVTTGLFYFLGFFLIQKTGSPMGMLLIVCTALTAVMGNGTYQAMQLLRDEMSKALLCYALVAPILFMIFPPKTQDMHVDDYTPSPPAGLFIRTLNRTFVLLGVTVLLYTLIPFNNVVLIIGGMYVLVQSAVTEMAREAYQRVRSALSGGAIALLILSAMEITGHLTTLSFLLFLAVLALGHMMLYGPRRAMTYQDAATIMISIVGTSLTSSDPDFAFVQRVGLTLGGVTGGMLLIVFLDNLFGVAVQTSLKRQSGSRLENTHPR